MSNPVAVRVTKTDHNSVEIPLLSSPPLSPAFNSLNKKQLQLQGGWTPSLIRVFSVVAVATDGSAAFEADTESSLTISALTHPTYSTQ